MGKKGKQVLRRATKAGDNVFEGRPSDIIIPVMGPTGVGKSSFINSLFDPSHTKVEVGHGLESCTSDLAPIVVALGFGQSSFINPNGGKKDTRLILVDTPGFEDTRWDDAEILRRISVWLARSYEQEMKLGGVIYLHDITQTHMLGTTRRNMVMFQKLVGEDALKCVVLGTTKWRLVDAQTGAERQKLLQEETWKDMVAAGSQVVAIGKDTTSLEVVNGILRRFDVTKPNAYLTIQEEIIDIGKYIPETEAGRTLRYTIQELIELQERKDDKKAREVHKKLQKMAKDMKIPFADLFARFFS